MRREGVEWADPGVTQSMGQTVAFIIRSTTRAKRVAKDLKEALEAQGVPRPYLACLDLASRFYGFRDYQALEAGIGRTKASPSLDDELAGAQEVAKRRASQVSVLLGEGLPSMVAHRILDVVRPSGRATRTPREGAASPLHSHRSAAPAAEPRAATPAPKPAADISMRVYIVEEDGRVIPIPGARAGRIHDRTEACMDRAGKEYRTIHAFYERVGRKPTRLNHCMGLFEAYDAEGLKVAEGPIDMVAVMRGRHKTRSWHPDEGHVGQVMRHLGLAG